MWVALAIAEEVGTVYETAGPFESEETVNAWIASRGIDAFRWQAVEIDPPKKAAEAW